MIAKTQYELSADDLDLLLALSRGKTLAKAGVQLNADGSTVFRSLKRIEKGLGQRLFERARSGYLPTGVAQRLLQHAETVEASLQAARGVTHASREKISGIVRISAVDAVLNCLVVPSLASLLASNAHLQLELYASNELTNLSRRDVDIALRSTTKPPPHLIGKRLGRQRFAVFAQDRLAKRLLEGRKHVDDDQLSTLCWVGVDDAMPEHPGVIWRKRNYPEVKPQIQANSSLTTAETIEAGLGVGVVALFHAHRRPRLIPLTSPLKDCEIDLWMLTHPESRHLRRIAMVAEHLAKHIKLGD
jgi:DNA-binding transcriptional LysR family regulator